MRHILIAALFLFAHAAGATEFPIFASQCYTKASNGCLKKGTDQTNYADVFFECPSPTQCTAAGTPYQCCTGNAAGCQEVDFYCDVEYPNAGGTRWTFTYSASSPTGDNTKKICVEMDQAVFIAGANFTSATLNTNTADSLTAPATANLLAFPVSSQFQLKDTSAATCTDANCQNKFTKFMFRRLNTNTGCLAGTGNPAPCCTGSGTGTCSCTSNLADVWRWRLIHVSTAP